MKKSGVLNKTIPTIAAIIVLIAGIAIGVYLIKQQILFGPKGASQASPKNVTISNVADNRFTVSWITEVPTTGSVKWGESEKLNKSVKDHREELTGESQNYTTHYVNIENLRPLTKYFFKIQCGDKPYDNQGQPFQITTGPSLGTQPATDVIYGQVEKKDGSKAEGAIIYINMPNTAPVSGLVGKDGMWAKPLHTARTTDLNSYISYDIESSVLTIKASLGLGQKENATVSLTTKNDTPVPKIILGENKDYRAEQTLPASSPEIPTTPEKVSSPAPSPLSSSSMPESYFSSLTETESPQPASSNILNILNPGQDGEEVNTQRPQILGKGPPEKVLTIKIESPETYTGTVTIDEQGNWEFTPPADLQPGEHTVTASYIDESGQEQKITRQFVVLAAGESQLPAFEGTPSASLSPSATSYVPPRQTMPSTEGGVPASGVIAPTFIVFILGLGFFLVGLWLQFFPKRSHLEM